MLAFEVEIDGEHAFTGGVEDWSVLGLHIAASRGIDIFASLGGLSQRDAQGVSYHFRWGRKPLSIGSRVIVTVVETDHPDPPVRRYRSDREVREPPFNAEEVHEMRRQMYLELKKEFESVTDE